MKILLGVIASDYLRAQTAATVVSVVKQHPKEVDFMLQQGCYLHENRRKVAEHALEKGYNYLFFVDSDMCFAAGVLQRFIDNDKDIVGAHYNMRRLPLCSTMKMTDENGKLISVDSEKLPKDKLFKVHALGTGCMLIKTSALQKIPKPWFWYGELGKEDTYTGEDVWFCRQAAKVGISSWCDPTVQAGHIGTYIY